MTEPELAALRRLWPNRQHESNWFKAALCKLGLHRWHTMKLKITEAPARYDFCRWCPEVKKRPRAAHRTSLKIPRAFSPWSHK